MRKRHSPRKSPPAQTLRKEVDPSGYRAVYAPLLVHHMSRGYSLASFAALVIDKATVVQQDPQASWVHRMGDFCKERVGRSTVERWRREQPDFAAAYEEGWSAALLFYEERLLATMTGQSGRGTGNVRTLLFVLRTRFSQVYSEHNDEVSPTQPEESDSSEPDLSQIDITKINDPEELLEIARRCGVDTEKERSKSLYKKAEWSGSSSPGMFEWGGVSPPAD